MSPNEAYVEAFLESLRKKHPSAGVEGVLDAFRLAMEEARDMAYAMAYATAAEHIRSRATWVAHDRRHVIADEVMFLAVKDMTTITEPRPDPAPRG